MAMLYGIPNCDTIRKARRWLDQHEVDYRFHDYRKDGLTRELLNEMERALGWEAILNRRGTTWRKLPESDREPLDQQRALQLMLAQPALIKRPVLELNGSWSVGFSESTYAEMFER